MVKYILGDSMNEKFISMLQELNLSITKEQYDKFEQYYQLLIDWNHKLNLTSITEQDEVYIKHFYDSLCLVKSCAIESQAFLDVGSGAGFPSIPLKIMFPNIKVTIIDALHKRIVFLRNLVDKIGVDVELIHGRVEEFKRRNEFDIVSARAVANMQMLSELCIPFVKVGGVFLCMKGPQYEEELKTSKRAIKILGGEVVNEVQYQVDRFKRTIIVVEKREATPPIYPRKYNKIKSKPL